MLPAALAGAAVAALAFGPLRSRIVAADAADRLRHRSYAGVGARAFGDRATRGVPIEELLRQLAEALRDTSTSPTVEVWTRDGAGLDRLLSLPHRAAR